MYQLTSPTTPKYTGAVSAAMSRTIPRRLRLITSSLPASSSRSAPFLLRATAIPTTTVSAPRLARPSHRTFATVSDADANPDDNDAFDPESVERATDEVDVCIVGGGPAGLSAAIRLKQLEAERGNEIRVVVLEKGSEVGK